MFVKGIEFLVRNIIRSNNINNIYIFLENRGREYFGIFFRRVFYNFDISMILILKF